MRTEREAPRIRILGGKNKKDHGQRQHKDEDGVLAGQSFSCRAEPAQPREYSSGSVSATACMASDGLAGGIAFNRIAHEVRAGEDVMAFNHIRGCAPLESHDDCRKAGIISPLLFCTKTSLRSSGSMR